MKFSELYSIKRTRADDWFDPILTVDTQLFVDPFLVYASPRPHFVAAHAEVVGVFDAAFHLIAASKGSHTHPSWIRAVGILRFPEVRELCLGYTSNDTSGSGSAGGFAEHMAAALWEAVHAGLKEISHFEEVGLLREGIGADRISDITTNILRPRLAAYTARICKRHNVPLRPFRYPALTFERELCRWIPGEILLPENPSSGTGLLLVPKRFLRDLPAISADPFWGYCYDNHNEVLRAEFGDDIARHVNKEAIVGLARRHPEYRREFIESTERSPPDAYDYESDRKGRVVWYDKTLAYCLANPAALAFTTDADFEKFVVDLVEVFRHFIEQNGGWSLLWNDDGTHKPEEAAQKLFLGIVKHYCKANNIDISKEANIGRGPVDFKVSQGHARRALIEVKMARNGKFWNGLEKQLPTYQHAEDVTTGVFLVIAQSEGDLKKIKGIQDKVKSVAARTGYAMTAVVVDATKEHLSASKL